MRSKFLALAFLVPFAASGLALAGPCKVVAKDSKSRTAQACEKGGVDEAVKEMKKMVKASKAKGVKFVCDDCHKNSDDYALTDNAKKDYEKLLANQ